MLDAEAAVARAVFLLDALVDVEQHADRTIADRVHHHLQAGFVGAGDPLVEVLRRVDEEAAILWSVGERFLDAAVCEPSEPSTNPFKPPMRSHRRRGRRPAVVRHRVAQLLPCAERHDGIDSRRQRAAPCARARTPSVGPSAHVVHRGDALLVDVLHRRVQRAVLISADGAGIARSTRDIALSLRMPGGLAVGVANDLAAGDVPRRARDAGGLQRDAVRQRHVAVEPIDPHGMIRRDGVDPLTRRQLAAPEAYDPSRRP